MDPGRREGCRPATTTCSGSIGADDTRRDIISPTRGCLTIEPIGYAVKHPAGERIAGPDRVHCLGLEACDVLGLALVDDMAAVGTISNKSCLDDFAEFCSALLQRSDSEKVTNLVSIAEHNVAEFFCDSFEVVTESVHQKHI